MTGLHALIDRIDLQATLSDGESEVDRVIAAIDGLITLPGPAGEIIEVVDAPLVRALVHALWIARTRRRSSMRLWELMRRDHPDMPPWRDLGRADRRVWSRRALDAARSVPSR